MPGADGGSLVLLRADGEVSPVLHAWLARLSPVRTRGLLAIRLGAPPPEPEPEGGAPPEADCGAVYFAEPWAELHAFARGVLAGAPAAQPEGAQRVPAWAELRARFAAHAGYEIRSLPAGAPPLCRAQRDHHTTALAGAEHLPALLRGLEGGNK